MNIIWFEILSKIMEILINFAIFKNLFIFPTFVPDVLIYPLTELCESSVRGRGLPPGFGMETVGMVTWHGQEE